MDRGTTKAAAAVAASATAIRAASEMQAAEVESPSATATRAAEVDDRKAVVPVVVSVAHETIKAAADSEVPRLARADSEEALAAVVVAALEANATTRAAADSVAHEAMEPAAAELEALETEVEPALIVTTCSAGDLEAALAHSKSPALGPSQIEIKILENPRS